MSGNQLSIPDNERDEPAVVQQIIDAPDELASAVQVSLAKRIITPHSSKILCLAARTSVPVADEETASVSDLALKLADGTNVVVSLSYFNDATVANCIPLTRNIYDPNRYSMTGDSSSALGRVFFTIAMAAVAGFLCLANKPNNVFYPYLHWNFAQTAKAGSTTNAAKAPTGALAKAAAPAQSPKVPSKEKSEISKATTAPKPITLVGSPPSKSSISQTALTSRAPRSQRLPRRAQSRSKAPRSYTYSADRDSMLVPPPPPVMMLSTQPNPNMMSYIPELMMTPQVVLPKATVPKTSRKVHLLPPPDSVTSSVQTATQTAPKQIQLPPVALPVSPATQQEVVMRPAKPHIKRIEVMSAPMPGNDPSYPSLERIQFPVPDSASL